MRPRGRRHRRVSQRLRPSGRPRLAGPLTPALARILERIHRQGPISFADYTELALYGEGGFFATGHGAGRARDFLTSPEVGPLFAAVLARALDEWWDELGRPDPYVVVDAGAGRGTLARDLVAAGPACAPALRVVLVERSETLRAQHADAVALEDAAWGFVGGSPAEGPLFASLSELPAEPVVGVIVANELLDNLPVLVLERGAEEWLEVRVGETDGRLVEVLVPAEPELAAEADRAASGTRAGERIPIEYEAKAWVRHALTLLERGWMVVVDYGAPTAELATRGFDGWFRTYRGHGRGGPPLDEPGSQDLTHDVATDQISRGSVPDSDSSQAEFLRAHGLDDLVATARATWTERAHIGDLEAMKARSRLSEADALCDPAGLGAFRVLEWHIP